MINFEKPVMASAFLLPLDRTSNPVELLKEIGDVAVKYLANAWKSNN